MTNGATGESDRSHATMKRKATYRSGSRGVVVGRPTQRLSVKSTMQEAGRWDDVGVDERCDRRVVVEGEAEEGEERHGRRLLVPRDLLTHTWGPCAGPRLTRARAETLPTSASGKLTAQERRLITCTASLPAVVRLFASSNSPPPSAPRQLQALRFDMDVVSPAMTHPLGFQNRIRHLVCSVAYLYARFQGPRGKEYIL